MTPLFGPPLYAWPVECKNLGPKPTQVAAFVRSRISVRISGQHSLVLGRHGQVGEQCRVVEPKACSAYDRRMLYGRDAERARIGELLAAARESRSGALVLRGEAGIGKSALLEDAHEQAADMHVLSARGVESESELPFAALHQLLRPALGS